MLNSSLEGFTLGIPESITNTYWNQRDNQDELGLLFHGINNTVYSYILARIGLDNRDLIVELAELRNRGKRSGTRFRAREFNSANEDEESLPSLFSLIRMG